MGASSPTRWRPCSPNGGARYSARLGPGKAEAVAKLVEGPLTAMTPASALQLHPHATVVIDEPAAAQLKLAGYYRETWAAKPARQGL